MEDNFRDSIGTIDEEGKRAWVFPKKPSGRFYQYRKWVSYGLLLFLFAAPFVKIGGNQFLMFNVLERRFNIFNSTVPLTGHADSSCSYAQIVRSGRGVKRHANAPSSARSE